MRKIGVKASLGVFLCLLLSTLALAAGPIVLSSNITNGQVTINGSGFVSPLTVSVNGKKLVIASSSSSQIVADLASPLAQGTYRLVVTAGSAQTVTALTSPGIISGFINADGTVQTGTGFTSSANGGTYTLTFPAGTFNGPTPPILTLTPFFSGGNALNYGCYSTTYPGDGSATIILNFSPGGCSFSGNPVPFTFIAVNGH